MSILYTVGFTKKNARTFFTLLVRNGVRTVIDVRLNNVSQLAGFTKRDDLVYFLELHGIGYRHLAELAPTADLLDGYKKGRISWASYETQYARILEGRERAILHDLADVDLDKACLLCSEATPEQCHRRLAAEWLKKKDKVTTIMHL